jgi:hypothetical protein
MNIEQLTGQVMANQKAAAIYVELDMVDRVAGAPGLADEYLQAKLAGDDAQCLALELYCRQVAMTFCHMPAVLKMLDDVERYKAMRKPGAGAPKMLKDIAGQIEELYSEGLYDRLDDGRIQFRVFTGGKPGQKSPRPHIKITCKNMPGAVALVAAKYRRGLPKEFGNGRAAR